MIVDLTVYRVIVASLVCRNLVGQKAKIHSGINIVGFGQNCFPDTNSPMVAPEVNYS